MIADFWHRLRYGVRILVKNSGFKLIAIFMLAAFMSDCAGHSAVYIHFQIG
jgi:hypothetical protein